MNNCQCYFCRKSPEEIKEYKIFAQEFQMTSEEYVKSEEGTYDPNTGLFACTICYIRNGELLQPQLLKLYKKG